MSLPLDLFTDADLADLKDAKIRLENPGLAARLADLLGRPIEAGFRSLPENLNRKIAELTQTAMMRGLEFAVRTMGSRESQRSRNWLHKLLVTGSGFAGGAAGLAALAVELPISTTIILRSIADIARSEGQDIGRLEVKLSCLEVLALGGRSGGDDSTAEGYWAVRAALARTVADAAAYIAERGLSETGAPPLVRFLSAIAARFSTVVTEEVAAKAIPILGAAAGGAVNYIFMDHFQEMARGHFVIRRLEEKYDPQTVESAYDLL